MASAEQAKHPFAHFAFMGDELGTMVVDPVTFRLESKKPDEFLDNVLDSLRDGEEQLTGERAGVLSCSIPEIESWVGLQTSSEIKNMTAHFFEKHAKPSVYAVTYVSDIIREGKGDVIYSDMPSLTFYNPYYDKKFGEGMPIYGERGKNG
jgi:hypothetical protein